MPSTYDYWVQALRQPTSIPNQIDWAEFNRITVHHNLEGLMWQQLRESHLPVLLAQAWQHQYYLTALRAYHFQEQLEPLIQAADSWQIPLVLLKGMALVNTVYVNPAIRPMVDIDLLVDRSQVATLWAIAGEHGFVLQPYTERHMQMLHRHTGELKLEQQRTHLLIEAHWWLYAGAWAHAAGLRDTRLHWRRLQSVQLESVVTHVLHAHDQLFHLGQHAMISNQFGQGLGRMLGDIDRVIRHYSIDWPIFWQEARRLGLQTVMWRCLGLTHSFYGTPIPFNLNRYAPPTGRRVMLQALTRPMALIKGQDLRSHSGLRFLLLLLALDHPSQRLRLIREGLGPAYRLAVDNH